MSVQTKHPIRLELLVQFGV